MTDNNQNEFKCEVCHKNIAIGVYCVPSVPYSCAYCNECLSANAHPWEILVANTACIGGLEYAAEFWRQMVNDTISHLGRTMEEFTKDVNRNIKEIDNYIGE